MEKVIEVSDFDMKRARSLMCSDGWCNPTDNEVFKMALDIRERMKNCNMSAKEAFFDIIH